MNPESRIMVSLSSPNGEQMTQALDIPVNTTKEQLQQILNQLLNNEEGEEEFVYSFFHGNVELQEDVNDLVTKLTDFNTERTLEITYHPQSLFRIKPITRQTAALEGHTQPVLAV